jgi:hypothetical protein
MKEKIKIKVGETIELTQEAAINFLTDPDDQELIENGHRCIVHCLDKETIQSAIISQEWNISNIDEWMEDDISYFSDIFEIESDELEEEKIKIKIGEMIELTQNEAIMYNRNCKPAISLIKNYNWRMILSCVDKYTIKEVLIKPSRKIHEIHENDWYLVPLEEFKDFVEVVDETFSSFSRFANKANDFIKKECDFQLEEVGFWDESDKVNRFSIQIAERLMSEIPERLMNEDYETIESDLIEHIEEYMRTHYTSICHTDEFGDFICYFYDGDEHDFHSIEEFENFFNIGE